MFSLEMNAKGQCDVAPKTPLLNYKGKHECSTGAASRNLRGASLTATGQTGLHLMVIREGQA